MIFNWDKSTTDICLFSPFLARTLLALPMVETNKIQTMATDGKRILYNPAFTLTLTHRERDGVRVHEALHVLLGHHVRAKSREKNRWNVACDMEINPYVLSAGYTLPKDALDGSQYAGKSAEEIYDLLPKDIGAPKWGTITVIGGTPEERQAALDDWRKMAASTTWSDMPANLARGIQEAVQPRPDVSTYIARWLSTAMPGHTQTWTRPNRRCDHLPVTDNSPSGHVVSCLDTSGSIRNADLHRYASSIYGLANVGRLDIIVGDTEANGVFENVTQDNIDQVIAELKGGGGTDFKDILDKADKLMPDAIVYFTDGYGDAGKPLRTPVLWALSTDKIMPWGDMLRLTNGEHNDG